MPSQVASLGSRNPFEMVVSLAQEKLGFDLTILVNAFLVLGAASAVLHYAGGAAYRWAERVCLSAVHIEQDDALYGHVMAWMVEQHLGSKRFRSVKATTPKKTTWEDEDEAAAAALELDRLVSYRSTTNRVPIKMAPFQSRDAFRYNGHWIFFSHAIDNNGPLRNILSGQQRSYLKLRCLGRSLEPIRALLLEAQNRALDRSMSTTNIWRGLPHLHMRETLHWTRVVSRPSRDIRTVILEHAKKNSLLTDINEYLHPRTRRWYANHGIPYRRGYLFSGAPGTGKTSLTAALAGVFGLDIYVLSLLDPALSESQLLQLLADVPSRCIVLLEDIDAAGLNRPASASQSAGSTRGGPGRRGARAEFAKTSDALAEATGEASTNAKSEISLSGLLNAIDGVSSHEGRVLVMTTNEPESLDKALVRPGRVDMHIEFELPRRPEVRELFLSMYRDIDGYQLNPGKEAQDASGAEGDLKPVRKGEALVTAQQAVEGGSLISDLHFEVSEELAELADRFAEKLPESKFSLAAIQGYLLRYKRDPREAVENAEEWGHKTLADA